MMTGRSTFIARFDVIASQATLIEAFARVAKAGGGAGGDGVSLSGFARDTRKEIDSLVRELSTGHYRPRAFRRYSIAKASGGRRMLAVPSIRDRIVQSAVAKLLNEALDSHMSSVSFAYRKGLSVEHAGALVMFYQLRGFGWAVDGDIEKFFDNVSHKRLIEILRRFNVCPDTLRLILLWLEHYAGCVNKVSGLPQGSPLSPVLANLYLTPFDKAIDTKRIKLVRYADDFLLLTRKKKEAIEAKQKATNILSKLGLRINEQKTRIVYLSDGVSFLGLRIKGHGIYKG